MKITKIILYWIMVAAIVTGAVYSYQKVQFGRKIAMLYQLATGNTAMGGPGGAPPRGGQMGMPGGQQQGMVPGGTQIDTQGQSQQGWNMQGGQPAISSEGAQGQVPSGEGGIQDALQMGQNMQGSRPDFQQGGRQGGPPGGRGAGGPGGGGPGGGKWYKISLRNVGPYTCLLAFFVLITCIIDKGIKKISCKKSACVNNAA